MHTIRDASHVRSTIPVFTSLVLLQLLSSCGREESMPTGPDTVPPLPPLGLSVFDARDGSVLLFWSANREGDLDGYRIYRTEESWPDSFQVIGETTETVFVDEGLEYDTTYLYTITAFDQSGNESERSNVVFAQPVNLLPPRRPRSFGVQAHNREDGVFISLQWNANTEGDLLGYHVYRSTQPDFSADSISLFDSTFIPSYRDTSGITVGSTFYYRVSAFDRGHFESTVTDAKGDRPLDRPQLDSPADSSTTPAFPTFRWHPVSDASTYTIFVSTARFSGEIWSSTAEDTAAIYGGPFLTSGATYYWKVGTITNTPWDPNSLSVVWSFRPE